MIDDHFERAWIVIGQAAIRIGAIVCVLAVVALYGLFHYSYTKPSLDRLAAIAKQQSKEKQSEPPEFEDGIHLRTGFIQDRHVKLVIANCTSCHSSKLVIQNRATERGWSEMIDWMQETQNLWDLGKNEAKIVQYLSTNYGPKKSSRRPNLEVDEWYRLSDQH